MTLISSKDPVAHMPRKLKRKDGKKTNRSKTSAPTTKSIPDTVVLPGLGGSNSFKSLAAFTDNMVNKDNTIIESYLFNIENDNDNDSDGLEGLAVFRFDGEDQQMCVVETSSLKSQITFMIGQFTLVINFSNIEDIIFVLMDSKIDSKVGSSPGRDFGGNMGRASMIPNEVFSALLRGSLGNSGLLGNVAGALEKGVNQYLDFINDALPRRRLLGLEEESTSVVFDGEQSHGRQLRPCQTNIGQAAYILRIVGSCVGAGIVPVTGCVISIGGLSVLLCIGDLINVSDGCAKTIEGGC